MGHKVITASGFFFSKLMIPAHASPLAYPDHSRRFLVGLVLVGEVFSAMSIANFTAYATVFWGVETSFENKGLTSGIEAAYVAASGRGEKKHGRTSGGGGGGRRETQPWHLTRRLRLRSGRWW
jgi:hypothetical protein